MAATKPRDLTPAGTWVGTTLSNLWLWAYQSVIELRSTRCASVSSDSLAMESYILACYYTGVHGLATRLKNAIPTRCDLPCNFKIAP